MTPGELHKRIMLHELRSILLDENRAGSPVPPQVRRIITQNRHDPTGYLVAADWFEEQGDDLGELIRIQCELIGLLTANRPDGFFGDYNNYRKTHPFHWDWKRFDALIPHINDPQKEKIFHIINLTRKRWLTVEELYPPRECQVSVKAAENFRDGVNSFTNRCLEQAGFDLDRPCDTATPRERVMEFTQKPKLGRTTRMLTDVLRYCVSNERKSIHVRSKTQMLAIQTARTFMELAEELNPGAFLRVEGSPLIHTHTSDDRGNMLAFLASDSAADITFTDHAVQLEREPGTLVLNNGRDFSVERTVTLTALGGSHHGERIEFVDNREWISLPEQPREWRLRMTELSEERFNVRYQVENYRRRTFGFAGRENVYYREYLVLESLSQEQALELAQEQYELELRTPPRQRERSCPKCTQNPPGEEHVCPYADEILGETEVCNCCESCTQACAHDI